MTETYDRPTSLSEALSLLMDESQNRQPMGGGTALSRSMANGVGVVDLQALELDKIEEKGQRMQAGACVRLDTLTTHPDVDDEIKRAIEIDASRNIRNMATLGGWLMTGDGRSVLTTVLLALDTTLTWEPDTQRVRLGNWLPLRGDENPGVLMTSLEWWMRPMLAFETVARSPKDRPLLIVAAAQWGSGRTRIALGGFGDVPIIAMDGPDDGGVDVACRDAYYEAGDAWASALYRREVAAKLALRCLDRIDAEKAEEA